MLDVMPTDESSAWIESAATTAREAVRLLARSSVENRNRALRLAAAGLRRHAVQIIAANERDLREFTGSAVFRDRLALDQARLEAMAAGLEMIAALPDLLGQTLESWSRPNGHKISRISVPIGVIGMIYESLPNVGVDAAGLCLKSGNAVVLRAEVRFARLRRRFTGQSSKHLNRLVLRDLPFRSRQRKISERDAFLLYDPTILEAVFEPTLHSRAPDSRLLHYRSTPLRS
jgi:hypothetical protein